MIYINDIYNFLIFIKSIVFEMVFGIIGICQKIIKCNQLIHTHKHSLMLAQSTLHARTHTYTEIHTHIYI